MGALLFLTIFGGSSIAAIIKSPKYALYLYVFVYFCMNEKVNWWVLAIPNFQWSLIAVVVLIVSCVVHWDKKEEWPGCCPSIKWLIAFFVVMVAILPFTVFPDVSSQYAYQFSKYIIIFILICLVVKEWSCYQWFIWLYLSGCFYFSFYAYRFPIRIQGRLEGIGPPDANDSNMFAALLVTTIPFIITRVLKPSLKSRFVSVVYLVFILNAIVLCSSRGAFIGLSAAMVVYVLIEKNKKRKIYLLFGVILAGCAFLYLSDDFFMDRLSTLEDPSAEGAGGRVTTWAYVFNMFKDHPFGAGGRSIAYMSPQYLPEYMLSNNGLRAAHNTYLTVLVEQGFIGLLSFLGFIMSVFWNLHKLRHGLILKIKGNKVPAFMNELYLDAGALIASLVGLLVCSIFIDRVYFEPLYWLCALSCVMVNFSKSLDSQELNTSG